MKVVFRSSKVICLLTVQPNFKQVREKCLTGPRILCGGGSYSELFTQKAVDVFVSHWWGHEFSEFVKALEHAASWQQHLRKAVVPKKEWLLHELCISIYPKLLWKYQQWLNMYIRHIYWYLTDVHKKYLNEISLTCQALTSTHLRLLNWSNDSCRSGEGESPTDRVLSNKKQRGTLAPSKNLKGWEFLFGKPTKIQLKEFPTIFSFIEILFSGKFEKNKFFQHNGISWSRESSRSWWISLFFLCRFFLLV